MNVKEIFNIALAVITSLGGGSAIVFALSSWLGKVWANRILEKEKSQHSKELEEYKSKLNSELERFQAIQDKAFYITKTQYDMEVRIYEEIWKCIHFCTMKTLSMYPIFDELPQEDALKEELYQTRYAAYCDAFNALIDSIDCYAPFYRYDLYNKFICLRDLCREMGVIFKYEIFDKKYNSSFIMVRDEPMTNENRDKIYSSLPEKITQLKSELQTEIRDYLLSLQLKE